MQFSGLITVYLVIEDKNKGFTYAKYQFCTCRSNHQFGT